MSPRVPHRLDGPWQPADHFAVIGTNLIGAVATLVCWIAAARQVRWQSQLSWLDGALTAVITVAVADVVWLISGMHRIRARRRLVVEGAGAAKVGEPTETTSAAGFVTSERMTLYHDPQCLLVQGKRTRPVIENEIRSADRQACRMCVS